MSTSQDLLDVGVRCSRPLDSGEQKHRCHQGQDNPIVFVRVTSRDNRSDLAELAKSPATWVCNVPNAGRAHPASAMIVQAIEELIDSKNCEPSEHLLNSTSIDELLHHHSRDFHLAVTYTSLSQQLTSTVLPYLRTTSRGLRDQFKVIAGQNRDQAHFTPAALDSAIRASQQMIDRYDETGDLPEFV